MRAGSGTLETAQKVGPPLSEREKVVKEKRFKHFCPRYLSSKGGKFNGATWETTTMYHFQVVNEAWIPAARMLAAAIG